MGLYPEILLIMTAANLKRELTSVAGLLALFSCMALCIAVGVYIGRNESRMDAYEQNGAEMTSAITSLSRNVDAWIAGGRRYSLDDAESQHIESYRNYVSNPQGFWLAKPEHIDRAPAKQK